jgi:hypothetical protein
MTALSQYVRLECGGTWSPGPDLAPRAVTVAFGDAALILRDGGGRPLAHWSLAALELRPVSNGARYAPGPDATEWLDLTEPEMIRAIETVHKAVRRAGPQRGRLRLWSRLAAVSVLLAALALWLPGALTRQALAALPEGAGRQIGAELLGHLQRQTGPACRAPGGIAALARLSARLFGPDQGQIVVLPQGLDHDLWLPGRIAVLPASALADPPALFAARALAASAQTNPLSDLIDRAGLTGALHLLTTGALNDRILAEHAAAILASAPPSPTNAQLIAVFAAAGVPLAPLALARDPTGESVLALIEADALLRPQSPAIPTDADWAAVTRVCDA